MKTYEQLSESLTKGVEWKWSRFGHFSDEATFVIQDLRYEVTFLHGAPYGTEVMFDQNGWVDVRNTGNAFAVFSTVGEIINSWIKRYKPDSFYFTCEPYGSRLKLYNRLSKLIAQKSNFHLEVLQPSRDVIYKFKRA